MKYIEEQLAKRKGQMKEEEDKSNKYLTPEEIAFSSVPEYLRMKSTVQSEEMLSNQMLSGIPEVDLGIEYDYIVQSSLHQSLICVFLFY